MSVHDLQHFIENGIFIKNIKTSAFHNQNSKVTVYLLIIEL